MMHMLEAGGIRVIQDTNEEIPRGKYAPEGVSELVDVGGRIRNNKKKWTKNKAVKIVTPYAEWYPIDRRFKAIFMLRDINEIITSLMAMKSVWVLDIPESINWARGYLQHNDIPTHFIKYAEVIKYPKSTALGIQDFLSDDLKGQKLNIEGMVKRVDPKARQRYKKDKTLLGYNEPDEIIRMDREAFHDVKMDPVVYDLPTEVAVKESLTEEDVEELKKIIKEDSKMEEITHG